MPSYSYTSFEEGEFTVEILCPKSLEERQVWIINYSKGDTIVKTEYVTPKLVKFGLSANLPKLEKKVIKTLKELTK